MTPALLIARDAAIFVLFMAAACAAGWSLHDSLERLHRALVDTLRELGR